MIQLPPSSVTERLSPGDSPSRCFAMVTVVLMLLLVLGRIEAQGVSPRDSARARAAAIDAVKDYLGVVDHQFVSEYLESVRLADQTFRHTTPKLVAAGARMIARLDSAARLSPRDQEILALRAYNLVITGRARDAERVVLDGCTSTPWWCSALLGFTRHGAGRYAEAEEDYLRALELMPREQRCFWDDISRAMNDLKLTDEYAKFGCEERRLWNTTIWGLADPLWIESGNDRRTEHYSRWMTAELVKLELSLLKWRTFRTDVMNRSLDPVVRFGRLEWFNGVTIGCKTRGRLNCTSHLSTWYAEDRYIPTYAVVRAPYAHGVLDYDLAPLRGGIYASANSDIVVPPWTLSGREMLRRSGPGVGPEPISTRGENSGGFGEVFVSSFGKVHMIKDAQVVFLLRGPGARLLAAFNPRDAALANARSGGNSCTRIEIEGWCISGPQWAPTLTTGHLRAGVAVNNESFDRPTVATVILTNQNPVRLALDWSTDSALVSLEARSVDSVQYPVAARHRFAVWRPDVGVDARIKLSDVIFYDAAVIAAPRTEQQILSAMLARSRVSRSEPVGLYWEVYGLREGEVLDFEVSVVPAPQTRGFIRSLAQSIGLASTGDTSLVRWTASPVTRADIGAQSEVARTVTVSLAALGTGDYVLELTARVQNNSTVRVRKELRIY